MRRGVDYSFRPPTPAQIRTAGATFVVRYVGVPGHVKNLTPDEALDLTRAGLNLVAVYQPSDGFLFSGENGVAHARRAWTDAANCGMPAGRPIYFALDVDPAELNPTQWARILIFLDQAASYLGRERVGVYGGREAIDRMVGGQSAAYGWQTRSWSTIDGQIVWSDYAEMRQVQHEVPLGSGTVDWNDAIAVDIGEWKALGGAVSLPARYPNASWHELRGEEQNEPAIRATQFIAHTMVGFLQQVEDMFDAEGNPIESHYGLGGPWDIGHGGSDGELRQWMPNNKSADANRSANRRPDGTGAISIETSDGGNPSHPWSPAQLNQLIRLGNWLCDNGDIPRRVCRTPDDPGLGYHSMWIGTLFMFQDRTTPWSTVPGKTCPGDGGSPVTGTTGPRIDQWKNIIVPAILAGRNPEEDDMTADEFIATIPDIAGAVADQLEPLLDKYSASPLFVKRANQPAVYRVHGEHLFHVQDPEHYRAASGGEGIAENVLTIADDDEIWLWPIHRS